jgi:hypothetical protein
MNLLDNIKIVWVLISCIAGLGCSHTEKSSSLDNPITIQMISKVGTKEVTKIYYHSERRVFSEKKIRDEKLEIVEFTTLTTTQKENSDGTFVFHVETIEKDGPVELHDLAYPELNEVIDMEMTKQGKVLKAGRFRKDSIFFVPPLPLPEEKVNVGDTWIMSSHWKSAHNGIPLRLEILTIFKKAHRCFENDICAELELDGEVFLPPGMLQGGHLVSQLKGKMLFSQKKGSLLWFEVRSTETLLMEKSVTKVRSCMVSNLEEPVHWIWKKDYQPFCLPEEPLGEVPDRVSNPAG